MRDWRSVYLVHINETRTQTKVAAESDTDMLDLAVRRGARGILHKEVAAEQVLKAIEKIHRGELWFDAGTMGRVIGQVFDARGTRADPAQERHAQLTARERDIVNATVEHSGSDNHVLAAQLFISEHTLRNHLTSIYRKLGVASRLELYVYAVRHALVGGSRTKQRRGPFTGR